MHEDDNSLETATFIKHCPRNRTSARQALFSSCTSAALDTFVCPLEHHGSQEKQKRQWLVTAVNRVKVCWDHYTNPGVREQIARQGILTWSGRAIKCDRSQPSCANCTRSNRRCQWDGLRLSWPRANDRRRAIVCKSAKPFDRVPHAGFVHTSHWDIELYQSLTSSLPVRALTLIETPIIWNPFVTEMPDQDLLEYCKLWTSNDCRPSADTSLYAACSCSRSVVLPSYLWA